jgi:hypothetical protein
MTIKNSGLAAGGRAHPEIRPGDKWKDSRGKLVIIESYRFDSLLPQNTIILNIKFVCCGLFWLQFKKYANKTMMYIMKCFSALTNLIFFLKCRVFY